MVAEPASRKLDRSVADGKDATDPATCSVTGLQRKSSRLAAVCSSTAQFLLTRFATVSGQPARMNLVSAASSINCEAIPMGTKVAATDVSPWFADVRNLSTGVARHKTQDRTPTSNSRLSRPKATDCLYFSFSWSDNDSLLMNLHHKR